MIIQIEDDSMKGYKLKAFMKTPKGKATLGLTGAAVLGAAAVMYPLFGTDSVVNVDEWVFKNDRNKYSQESVMANVKLYKEGVFVPEEKEEGTSDAGEGDSGGGSGDSGAQTFDPNNSGGNGGGSSNENVTTIPEISSGNGKVCKTLPHDVKLYDGPTVKGNSYIINKPDSYRPGNWLMCAEGLPINSNAVAYCKDKGVNYVSGAGCIDDAGRHRVAVGPKVTNKDFNCDNIQKGLGAEETYKYTVFDVVIKDKSGKEYWWPLTSGCAKAHTYPTGVLQTDRHVHWGGDWGPGSGLGGCDDSSLVETVEAFDAELKNAFAEFEFVKFQVYTD